MKNRKACAANKNLDHPSYPLYTGGHFHCYMLDESICHFRGVGSVLSLLCYFRLKILLANNVDPDQMPHYVASDLGLRCLPMTLLRVSGKNGSTECESHRKCLVNDANR